jgi:hypothetical protein
MEQPRWADGLDPAHLQQPSRARVHDYLLGGAHNLSVDRELADALVRLTPGIGPAMRAHRAFLRRVVRFLVEAGVTQFLDIGSGIPTMGHVHEVAQRADPVCRVVYVDVDPVAVAHSRALLADNPNATVLRGDVREVEAILQHPQVTGMLDFGVPIALLALGVLHFVPDADDPAGIVARLCRPLVSGSYVALVNATGEDRPPAAVIDAQKLSGKAGAPIFLRSHDELMAQFDGLPLVAPGLVHLPLWRPDTPLDPADDPARYGALAGVARVP